MKNKLKIFLIIIIIILIIIIYILNEEANKTLEYEEFNPNIFRFDFESKEPYMLSKNQFNEKFNTNIPNLDIYMAAVGFDMTSEPNVYIHVDYPGDSNYLSIIVDYWNKYIHNGLNKQKYSFVLCFADGYLPNTNEPKLDIVNEKRYITYQSMDNPLKHVFAFAKRYYDTDTICIPDPYYCGLDQHNKVLTEVTNNNVDWNLKNKKCIWRGNIKNNYHLNFYDESEKSELTPREYFVKLYKDGKIDNFNYEETFTSIAEQIKYRYILDIDGYSSTWDATVWKLFSGSVLLKVKGTWTQWYYDELIEWEHYVPINNDFSDLNEKIEWCINNDDKCKKISENANNFVVNKLNLKYVNNKIIKKVKNFINF
jgi:glycosyltransferase involved in cell wall biosynthesis